MCTVARSKRNIYILFSWTSLFLFFYSFYQIWSFIHSHSHSLSFISQSSQAPLSQRRRHRQAHSGTVQLAYFFFSFYQIRSHSLSLIHCHLSSQASQAHSLNVANRTIVNVVGPISLSQLWSSTHETRRRSKCLTGKPMELAVDRSACLWILVLSCRWSEIWVFFFSPAMDWWWWWLWLWLWGKRLEIWVFFFFFFSCCGLLVVVVVLMVFVGVVVVVSDGGIYYFIVVIILFYCDVYIILLC